MDQRSVTLNLPESEACLLEKLSQSKSITKTALIRHCIRIYAMIDERLARGESLYFEDKDKKKTEMLLL